MCYKLKGWSYWGCNVVYEIIVVHKLLLFMTCLDAFQVASFPFDDHNCPPIQLIKSFCQSAYSWLKEDIENVVVVHCKAGMARTGLMICSLLLFLKVRFYIRPHWKLWGLYQGKFSFLVLVIAFLTIILILFCHLSSVLPNSQWGHGLLQPEKMHWWEGSGSPKSDCQSIAF
jgi:hypothetical protein